MAALIRRIEALGASIANLDGQIAASKGEERSFANRIRSVENVLSVASFEEFDFQSEKAEALRLTEECEALEATSDLRKTLVDRLREFQNRIDSRKPEIHEARRLENVTEEQLSSTARIKARIQDKMQAFEPFSPAEVEGELISAQEGAEVTLENVHEVAGSVDKRLGGQIGRQSSIINAQTNTMLLQMKEFLHECGEEAKRLQATAEYAEEFVRVLDEVVRHDLPTYTERFENFLGTNLVGNVASLQTRLNLDVKAIREQVTAINHTLAGIEFRPGTFIELIAREVLSGEIAEFKGLLTACIANTIRPAPEERARIFSQIQQLMARFDTDDVWMRRVTDTRNWLEFRVRELDRETGKEVDVFQGSQGRSGGQKARLAFALLASAIATQYGLIGGDSPERSFRLVVIDEAFARTDEENSLRALELFRNLGLQLLIVSPFDAKSRIVEDFVDSFHLTTNPNRNSSSVQRASRVEYTALRKEAAVA